MRPESQYEDINFSQFAYEPTTILPPINTLVTRLVANQTTTLPIDFHYGLLPLKEQRTVEQQLHSIERNRDYDPITNTLRRRENPLYHDTVHDHVSRMLQMLTDLQAFSLKRGENRTDYLGLAQVLNFSRATTIAIVHDIGEFGPGDLPRVIAAIIGDAAYQKIRQQYEIEERASFTKKTLPIFRRDSRHHVSLAYNSYEDRFNNPNDIESHLIHVLDKLDALVFIHARGIPMSISVMTGGLKSAIDGLHVLHNALPQDAWEEVSAFVQQLVYSLDNADWNEMIGACLHAA